MTIILAIWAAAAVAGTVTAVVMNHKKKPQAAICDTCECLHIRNDKNEGGTVWVCGHGRVHQFTDPPEYCKAYIPRSLCAYDDRQEIPRMTLIKSIQIAGDDAVQVQECVVNPEILQVPEKPLIEQEKLHEYVWQV